MRRLVAETAMDAIDARQPIPPLDALQQGSLRFSNYCRILLTV